MHCNSAKYAGKFYIFLPIYMESLKKFAAVVTISLLSSTVTIFPILSGQVALAQTETSAIIIDDGDKSFKKNGAWASFPFGGYQGDFLFAQQRELTEKKKSSAANWKFGNLEPGTYELSATWNVYPELASNAPYTVMNKKETLLTTTLNQQIVPNGEEYDGRVWQSIGTFTVDANPVNKKGKVKKQKNQITVSLTNEANGYVIADAVRIVEKVEQPESNGTLSIAVKSLASTDNAVENQKDINLLRFEARAEGEDILLTGAIFESDLQIEDLQNVQNYALWVDSDENGLVDIILEDGIVAQGNSVRFADLAGGGFVVPTDGTVIFEVHGDVSSSLVSNNLKIEFSTPTDGYITAEELDDGSSLEGIETNGFCVSTCDITVFAEDDAPTHWHLVSQGNLFVTKDSTPTRNHQVLGGELSDPLMILDLRADSEPIDVTYIGIDIEGEKQSIDRLELYLEGSTTPFAYAVAGGAEAGDDFGARMENQQLVITEGNDMAIFIRAHIKSDTNGGASGDEFAVAVDNVLARGAESSNDLSINDGDESAEGEIFIGNSAIGPNAVNIMGSNNVVVMSKIASITNANPDSDNTPIPTGMTPFGQFKFTAAANSNSYMGTNSVVLTDLIFNINATNVEMSGDKFRLYNKADYTVSHACTVDNNAQPVVSGSMLVVCKNIIGIDASIYSGDAATFVLEGEVVNSQVSASATSILKASLQQFNDIDAVGNHISWQDEDYNSSTSVNWVEYPETVVNSTAYRS